MPADKADKTQAKWKYKVGMSLAIAIGPLIIFGFDDDFLAQAMRQIGVRLENVTIQIPEQYNEVLLRHNIDSDNKSNANRSIYSEADILFRGIGNKTVIDIQGVRISVPSEDVVMSFAEVK